jgi:bifunctional NMN adenylyltransferase/nudix hydrolase
LRLTTIEEDVENEVAVIIGRWQILQKGHIALLRTALSIAPRIIIVVGSAWRARDAHNPFTWEERQQQFEAVLSPEERARTRFLPVRDFFDEQRWNDAVRAGVLALAGRANVTLVGFRKDHSSAYLDQFAGWRLHEVEPTSDISATDLRRVYFEAADMHAALTVIGNYVEPGVRAYLEAWAHLPAYRQCAAEHRAVVAYRARYPQPFSLTADVVLTCAGHVLLIQRGGEIGNGLWACPAGGGDGIQEPAVDHARGAARRGGLRPPASQCARPHRDHGIPLRPG